MGGVLSAGEDGGGRAGRPLLRLCGFLPLCICLTAFVLVYIDEIFPALAPTGLDCGLAHGCGSIRVSVFSRLPERFGFKMGSGGYKLPEVTIVRVLLCVYL